MLGKIALAVSLIASVHAQATAPQWGQVRISIAIADIPFTVAYTRLFSVVELVGPVRQRALLDGHALSPTSTTVRYVF